MPPRRASSRMKKPSAKALEAILSHEGNDNAKAASRDDDFVPATEHEDSSQSQQIQEESTDVKKWPTMSKRMTRQAAKAQAKAATAEATSKTTTETSIPTSTTKTKATKVKAASTKKSSKPAKSAPAKKTTEKKQVSQAVEDDPEEDEEYHNVEEDGDSNQSPQDSIAAAQASIQADNDNAHGMHEDTFVVKADGSIVHAKKLKEGDYLMGIDGGPRKVSNLKRGQASMYELEILGHRGRDKRLIVTGDYLLHLQTSVVTARARGLITTKDTEVEHRVAELLGGPLSTPTSSQLSSQPRPKTKVRGNFQQAFRSAVAFKLKKTPIDSKSFSRFKNAILGTMGIELRGQAFYVIRKGHLEQIFGWGSTEHMARQRAQIAQYFDTKEQAFVAATRMSRGMHEGDDDPTIFNLAQRLQAARAKHPAGVFLVDQRIPGVYLVYSPNLLAIRTKIEGRYHSRRFAFPNLPSSITFGQNMNTGAGDDPEENRIEANLALYDEHSVVAVTSVKELANLSPSHRNKYFFKFCEGFEFEEQSLAISPYFLGLWLGDGNRSRAMIFNNLETEIVDFLKREAIRLNAHLSYTGLLNFSIVDQKPRGRNPLPQTSTMMYKRSGQRRQRPRALRREMEKDGWTFDPFRNAKGRILRYIANPPITMNLEKATRPRQDQPPAYMPQDPDISMEDAPTMMDGAADDPSPGDYGLSLDGAGDKRDREHDSLEVFTTKKQRKTYSRKEKAGKTQLFPHTKMVEQQDDEEEEEKEGAIEVAHPKRSLQMNVEPPTPTGLDRESPQQHSKRMHTSQLLPPSYSRPSSSHFQSHDLYFEVSSHSGDTIPDSQEEVNDLISGLSSDPEIAAALLSESEFLVDPADSDIDEEDDDELDDVQNTQISEESETTTQQTVEDDPDYDDEDAPIEFNPLDLLEDEEVSGVDIITEEKPSGSQSKAIRSAKSKIILPEDIDDETVIELEKNLIAGQADIEHPDTLSPKANGSRLLDALRKFDLITEPQSTGAAHDKKHIPPLYFRSSTTQRLQLLAGLIDSDGSYHITEHLMVIVQSKRWHERLFWDIVRLARGLGFRVSTCEEDRGVLKGIKLHATLTGHIDRIPCVLLRKQASVRFTQFKPAWQVKSIKEIDESANHVSFELDKDHRHIRWDHLILAASNAKEAIDPAEEAAILKVAVNAIPYKWDPKPKLPTIAPNIDTSQEQDIPHASPEFAGPTNVHTIVSIGVRRAPPPYRALPGPVSLGISDGGSDDMVTSSPQPDLPAPPNNSVVEKADIRGPPTREAMYNDSVHQLGELPLVTELWSHLGRAGMEKLVVAEMMKDEVFAAKIVSLADQVRGAMNRAE